MMSDHQNPLVHRFRSFIPDSLSFINCLSLNGDSSKLAVLRRELSQSPETRAVGWSLIEIWNIRDLDNCFLEQPVFENDASPGLLEAVAWGNNDRLFSCGLNGRLNEYDLSRTGRLKQFYILSGQAWCMSFDSSLTLIAVGTEQGHVQVYRLGDGIHEDAVNFEGTIGKSESRVLCLKWFQHQAESFLVTGSMGIVKIWSYKTHQCIDIIQIGNPAIAVWCLIVLDDFTIVTGDSTGATSFWDGRSATLLSTFTSHKGDVLCLCKDQLNTVYSSGVDPIIASFRQDTSGRFVAAGTQQLHTHDVRALAVTPTKLLFSGGMDSKLYRYFMEKSHDQKLVRTMAYFGDNVHVIGEIVLLQYRRKLALWRLGTAKISEPVDIYDDGTLALSKDIEPIIELNIKDVILKSAFSGSWIVCSTYKKVKVFFYDAGFIKKVPFFLNAPGEVVDKITFADENRVIISTGISITIAHLDCSGHIIEHKMELEYRAQTLSACQSLFAYSHSQTLHVFQLEESKEPQRVMEHKFPENILSTAFDIVNGEISCLIQRKKLMKVRIPRSGNEQKSEVVTSYRIDIPRFYPKEVVICDSIPYVYDDCVLVKVNKPGEKCNQCRRYQNILKISPVSSRKMELVIIELTPEQLLKQLPPRLRIKKFGT